MSADVYARFTLPKLLCLSVGTLLAWLGLAAGAGREPGAGLGRWPLAAPSAACAAVLLLSSLFSLDPAVSVLGDVRLSAYGLLELGLLAALHLAAAAARPEVRIRDVLGAVAASAAALSAYGLAQKAGFEPMPGLALALPEGRITALNGNPVWLGASLLMGLPAALFFALSPRRSERLLGASAFALTAVGVLLTFSRAAWAGAATACAAYALLRAPARRPWLAPAAAAAALAAALVWGSLGGQRHGLMRSDSHRVQFWLASLRAFARDPVLGSGPDTLEAALGPVKDAAFLGALGLRSTTSHAHNDWLQALATTGALGLGAYLWLQLALLRAARDALAGPGREEAAALAAALAGLFVQMKLNLAPLPSLALAAVFSGFLLPGPLSFGRASARLVCAPLAAAAALSLVLFRADAAFLRGVKDRRSGQTASALAEFRRAADLNPANPEYWTAAGDQLWTLFSLEPVAARRLTLVEEAVAGARRAVRWRPGAVEARNLLGVWLLRLAKAAGRPEPLAEAEAELGRAAALDAGSTVARENALLVARGRGQADRAAALDAELARLRGAAASGKPQY